MASTCGEKFKYVCEIKGKVDALDDSIKVVMDKFVQNYVNYQKAVNVQLTPGRPTPDISQIPNPNYEAIQSILVSIETMKNEISGKISENSKVMQEMDKTITKNKKITSAVSSEMSNLSNKAEGSSQAYKDALGLYRRDIFKNLVFICASGGIIYLSRKVFMESAT